MEPNRAQRTLCQTRVRTAYLLDNVSISLLHHESAPHRALWYLEKVMRAVDMNIRVSDHLPFTLYANHK